MQLINKYFPDLSNLQEMQFKLLLKIFPAWNDKINMVSRKDINNLELNHLLHSLTIAKFAKFKANDKVLDIGTGGGFPGLPLAILYPQVQFALCDSVTKKVKVVNSLIQELELVNASGYNSRVESINKKFDHAVTRAVAPLNKLISWTQHNVKGNLYSLKGGNLEPEIEESVLLTKQVFLKEHFDEDFFETKQLLISQY